MPSPNLSLERSEMLLMLQRPTCRVLVNERPWLKLWEVRSRLLFISKVRCLPCLHSHSSKKTKATIASGLQPGDWLLVKTSASQPKDRDNNTTNNHNDNAIGGLEDQPPSPRADHIWDNEVSTLIVSLIHITLLTCS